MLTRVRKAFRVLIGKDEPLVQPLPRQPDPLLTQEGVDQAIKQERLRTHLAFHTDLRG